MVVKVQCFEDNNGLHYTSNTLVRFTFVSLQAEGYHVWIDVEQMGGSTLEAMAEAVENACVVIICVSEKYKLSPNARTGIIVASSFWEAKYMSLFALLYRIQ